MLIHIIGPGGAGKTTTGKALADTLNLEFIDLDIEYLKRGNIDDDIRSKGYEYYVKTNTQLYLDLVSGRDEAVLALSAGFMTYSASLHPEISTIHRQILSSPSTVLLMPSFELEECVKEIVKRQMLKPYMTSTAKEQTEKILTRFPIYQLMGRIRVTTNKSMGHVVDEIVSQLNCA